MANADKGAEGDESMQQTQSAPASVAHHGSSRYGWRVVGNTMEAIKFTFNAVNSDASCNAAPHDEQEGTKAGVDADASEAKMHANNEPDSCASNDNCAQRTSEAHQDPSGDTAPREWPQEAQQPKTGRKEATVDICNASTASMHNNNQSTESTSSIRSIGSFVCRICHTSEHTERLVSPCLCKGSLTYVHIYCLEHWISTSGKTTCELCQFRYHTVQTLRYTCLQSLRMWYSHSMSRRALQEDCQMFSLLTLVAFGIVGTILVGIQYYIAQEKYNYSGPITRLWTKGWLGFFLIVTFTVYFTNVYMIARGQLGPWYRWWQSAKEIKLILENRQTCLPYRRLRKADAQPLLSGGTTAGAVIVPLQDACRSAPIAGEEVAMGTVFLNPCPSGGGGRHDDLTTTEVNAAQQSSPQQPEQMHQQPLPQSHPRPHQAQTQDPLAHDKRNQVAALPV